MKQALIGHQQLDLYGKYNGQDREISGLRGEYGFKGLKKRIDVYKVNH
jgi:hypothetical protein